MNKITIGILIASSLLFVASCQNRQNSSQEIASYLQDISFKIQNNALYADSIDWPILNNKVDELSRGLSSLNECQPVIDTLIQALRQAGDKHSFFIARKAVQKLKSPADNIPQPRGRYFDDGIGYISIPAFASENPQVISSFASLIQREIKIIDSTHSVKAWMVDLRGNSGGNMYPMIAGLNCLMQDGVYGYFSSKKQGAETELVAVNGSVGQAAVDVPYKIKNLACSIAVLIDSQTASSGEMTALSFRPLSNVRFFGQKSAGYTTVNQIFTLSDGSYLALSTSYMEDRNRMKYPNGIFPDEITPLQKDSLFDSTIAKAKFWLQSKK